MNIVCELFPPIYTEGFHCAGQGCAIFAANSRAVCQPNAMRIRSDIVANSHRVLCVKAFTQPPPRATPNYLNMGISIYVYTSNLEIIVYSNRKYLYLLIVHKRIKM